ncbi:MAG: hypothetical protein ACTHU0_00970 [Kofleriaceae bacterium]
MNYPPRNAEQNQERILIPFFHAEQTANATLNVWRAPVGRAFRIDRVLYINPTGLAADATNAFRCELKNGATLVATVFNTDSNDAPTGAALVANTFIELTSDAEIPSRLVDVGNTLSIVFTEDGTAILPPGQLFVEGCLL